MLATGAGPCSCKGTAFGGAMIKRPGKPCSEYFAFSIAIRHELCTMRVVKPGAMPAFCCQFTEERRIVGSEIAIVTAFALDESIAGVAPLGAATRSRHASSCAESAQLPSIRQFRGRDEIFIARSLWLAGATEPVGQRSWT